MKVGFYYHIPGHNTLDGIFLPGYLGVFIDALASKVSCLILFIHQARSNEIDSCDYKLQSSNIIFISMGFKSPGWDRYLFPSKTLKRIDTYIDNCDILLIRGPSPLAPQFYFRYGEKIKVCYLLVGDYREGAKHLQQPWWRLLLIKMLLYRNDNQLRQAISRTKIFVNSQSLYEKYKEISHDIYKVKTSTLQKNDFSFRIDTCNNTEVKILYTGRIDLAKGLKELVEAIAILIGKGYTLSLHIVGWEDKGKTVEKFLIELAKSLNIKDKVVFHGKKKLGEELNSMYRLADVYVIPSYHEGFPRTIWEAMANSLPVVATNVGSISINLTNEKNAVLIQPKNTMEIVKAIEKLILEPELRRNIIAEGYNLACSNTIDVQVNTLIKYLKDENEQIL